MSSDNFTVQIGNLTDDPELRFTNNGTAVANFSLAVNTRVRDGETWRDGETHFFRVNVWRDQAENVAESLHKGNRAVDTLERDTVPYAYYLKVLAGRDQPPVERARGGPER